MRARRNRVIAFVVAGVLVLAVAFGGMILSLGKSQGPGGAATAPAGGSATTMPINQSATSISGASAGEGEMGDGAGDGGFQTKQIHVTSHKANAPTTVKATTASANGG